jgi:mono/diheme cytochrome c family protein
MKSSFRAALAVLVILLTVSCGSGDRPLSAVDPEAAPAVPTYEMVAAILDRNCVPCHHAGKVSPPPRLGPLGEDEEEDDDAEPYDTCEGIRDGIDGILDTAIDGGSMPPGAWPRLDERERLIITRWVEQGACSPCKACP